MDKNHVLAALAALGQETRLDVFRLLVRMGEAGCLAGDIGRELGIVQNTLSAHLAILHQAGLVCSQREGRSIRYLANLPGMRALMEYLARDCCGGQPDLCLPMEAKCDCP